MNRIVTKFDTKSWEKSGIAWLRHAKSQGYYAVVIDDSLSIEAKQKIQSLNFQSIPRSQHYFDYLATIVEHIPENERWLWVPNHFDFKKPLHNFFGVNGIGCLLEENPTLLAHLVLPIIRLQDRVTAALLLEDRVQHLFEPIFLAGEKKDWQAIFTFYDALKPDYLDLRHTMTEKLLFNLFTANDPVRVIHVK